MNYLLRLSLETNLNLLLVNRMEKVVIAVDAGGTKTKVSAINQNKEVVFESVGGPGSPAVLRFQAYNNILEPLRVVFNEVKDKYDVTFIQIGVSGFGVLENISEIENKLYAEFGVEVKLNSDADIGLYSIIEDKYDEGILVLAGTGSAVSGIKNGKIMLVGGFGALLTECGSSYFAVKSLVMNIINQYEETLTYSELGKEFMKLIGAEDVGYFRKFMYLNTKTEIASYAKFISKQANLGNEEAIKILKDSGRDLAVLVRRVYKNLGLTEKAIIGFRGSFVQKAPYVKEELMKNLDGFGIHLNIFEGDQDPVFGAFYMARRKGKI